MKNSSLVENLGWTLVHSIWQIGLIALTLFLILRSSKNFSANARYLSAVSALAFTLILPLATFFWLENNAAQNRFASKKNSLFSDEPRSKLTGHSPENFRPKRRNHEF